MTTRLRDYTKIKKKHCQLLTHYEGNEFSCPHITMGPKDEVVMVDNDYKKVIILDKDLKLIGTFGQGNGDSKLNDPVGIAVGDNVIAVSEYSDNVVKKCSLQGDYLSKFGSQGSGDGQFIDPHGLCFNSKGLLYVVDNHNRRVQVFREDNVFLFKFGFEENDYPRHVRNLRYIAVYSSDQVYVTDSTKYGGICVFSEDGHFLKMINCNEPFAIGIAPDDHIITHDDNVLTIFNPTHELIAKFGETGKEKGQLNGIQGIAINSRGTIFVTEFLNACLQIIKC